MATMGAQPARLDQVIGVDHRHPLGARVAPGERLVQRPGLVAWPARQVEETQAGARTEQLGELEVLHQQAAVALGGLHGSRQSDRTAPTYLATTATDPQPLLTQPVHELPPLRLCQVAGSAHSRLWNETIARYHYLGYTPMAGSQSRYFVFTGERLVALLSFGARAWKLAARERFIGWHEGQRQRNLPLVVNNAPFSHSALDPVHGFGLQDPLAHSAATAQRLAGLLRLPPGADGNLRRDAPTSRHLLPGSQLDQGRSNRQAWQKVSHPHAHPASQGHLALSAAQELPLNPLSIPLATVHP
jgi:hypothetical protein